jgi:hypothetical protein
MRRVAFVDIHAVSLAACVAVIIGLGAMSIGHEYSHRTLGLVLTLPMRRRRVLLIKQAVLCALVLPLVLALWRLNAFDGFPAMPWFAAAAAFCTAPIATMLCRSPLAGAVLGASVPATALVIMTVIAAFLDPSAQAQRVAREWWTLLMIPAAATGLVLGWRRFVRLEAFDGGIAAARPAPPTTARGGTPRHFVWRLAGKELGLQQMALVMTGLYSVTSACAAIAYTWRGDDAAVRQVFSVASAIYWLGLPMLAGSLATAEERHLGTLAWQRLLPVPLWQQWAVKIGAVLGLALLAAVVPVLLARMFWPTLETDLRLGLTLAVVMTSASVYISSLCRSGVQAAVVSLTIVPATSWLMLMGVLAVRRAPFDGAVWGGREGAWLTLALLLAVPLLALAFVNHRPEPPAAARVGWQLLALGVFVGFAVVVLDNAAAL